MSKDTSVIPEGDYCYSRLDPTDRSKTVNCPYWSELQRTEHPIKEGRITTRPGCGYCDYLGKSDNDLKKEGYFMPLLWDQVKECGVKKPRRG